MPIQQLTRSVGHLRQIVASTTDLLLPRRCPVSGEATDTITGLLSSNARRRILGLPSGKDGEALTSVANGKPAHVALFAPFQYLSDAALAKAIIALKHQDMRGLAPDLAELARPHFRQVVAAIEPDIIIPVPLHWRRQWSRGFNQADLLLQAIVTDPETAKRLSSRLLQRHRHTQMQRGASASKRRDRVKGAFSCPEPSALTGKRILLVDDVITTGSTIQACAEPLFAAGAVEVSAWALGRPGGHS